VGALRSRPGALCARRRGQNCVGSGLRRPQTRKRPPDYGLARPIRAGPDKHPAGRAGAPPPQISSGPVCFFRASAPAASLRGQGKPCRDGARPTRRPDPASPMDIARPGEACGVCRPAPLSLYPVVRTHRIREKPERKRALPAESARTSSCPQKPAAVRRLCWEPEAGERPGGAACHAGTAVVRRACACVRVQRGEAEARSERERGRRGAGVGGGVGRGQCPFFFSSLVNTTGRGSGHGPRDRPFTPLRLPRHPRPPTRPPPPRPAPPQTSPPPPLQPPRCTPRTPPSGRPRARRRPRPARRTPGPR